MTFFRETLTVLAALLALALGAAFVGPYFVDWTAHRAWVEDVLSEGLGARVRVAGAIDVGLLPAPRLDLREVSVRAAAPGGPAFEADRLRLELSVSPLLRGAIRFVEASFDRPRLRLVVGEDGAVALPRPPARAPEEVAFERLEVRGGDFEIVGLGPSPLHLTDVSLDAEAGSLVGPFRGNAAARLDGRALALRFGTGALEGERLRLKASLDSDASMRAEIDGAAVFAAAPVGVKLGWEGAASVSGALDLAGVALPWRIGGPVSADGGRLLSEQIEARIGAEERPTTASGRLDWTPAEGVSLRLAAQQIDLDRLFGGDPAAGEPMRRVLRALGELGAGARSGGFRVAVEASAPTAVLGGETITDLKARVATGAGEPQIAFEAGLPGSARLALSGALEGGVAARFVGRADAGARDLPRLADWIGRADPDLGARLRGLPFRRLEASGLVEASRAAVATRDLALRADRSTLTGAVVFTRAVGGERARLFADLSSPALDLDSLPDLSGPARAAADVDLSIALEARAVRLARVGEGMVDAGRIAGRLTKTGGALELERLSVENLGGATLRATGRADGESAEASVSLDAQRLVDLAALVKRVAPGAFADALSSRAVSLSPARLSLKATAAAAGGAFQLRTLSLEGSARGTRVSGTATPEAGGGASGSVTLQSSDAPMLLRQIGVETLPLPALGGGRVEVSFAGEAARGLTLKAVADLAGSGLSFEGRASRGDEGWRGEGQGRLSARDAAPLLQMLAFALPGGVSASLPLDVGGRLSLAGGVLDATDLAGSAAGAAFSGRLRAGRERDGGRVGVTGALSFERLSLMQTAALALGPPQAARPGALWSDRRFAPGLSDAPPADIRIDAKTFELRGGLVGRDATMRLVLGPGLVSLEEVSTRVGDVGLEGRLTLRRDKADAALAATLALDVPLTGRPDVSGQLTTRLDLAATGVSEAALAANLAGSGIVRIADLRAARADPAALDRVVAEAEKDALGVSENAIVSALGRELDKGALAAGDVEFQAVIASGALRLQPQALSLRGVEGTASAAFDLRSLTVEEVLELTSRAPPKDWTGAPPALRIVWRGPWERPARMIEATNLVNGLSARAILREAARIEALEFDIKERAWFNRRLKAQEWLRRREGEIAAWKVEQARLAEEARKKAEEEERRRVEEERRKAIEAARLERERAERERVERERAEREKRAAEAAAERAAAEAARAAAQQPPPPPMVITPPGGAQDPAAFGRY